MRPAETCFELVCSDVLRIEILKSYLASYKMFRSVVAETQRSDIDLSPPYGFHLDEG
jgi:hypothetical protein